MINFIEPEPTMSIDGGVIMYCYFTGVDNPRYNDKPSPRGRKVRFLDKNGYSSQLDVARKCFDKGDILTVKEIYVDRSSSSVEFLEVSNKRFNTVMFEDVYNDNFKAVTCEDVDSISLDNDKTIDFSDILDNIVKQIEEITGEKIDPNIITTYDVLKLLSLHDFEIKLKTKEETK